MIFVLTHEYSDHSGFTICGVSANRDLATAWYRANDENNVYVFDEGEGVEFWSTGKKSWRIQERERDGS